jgi:hypothetical protein
MNKTIRRYDIDWLRVLATGGVFLFHTARFFNDEGWHVKNNMVSDGASLFVTIANQWLMPLFFLLAALSISYALARRSNGQYLSERLQRLVVPLVFGILALTPPQVYVERVSHGEFAGSFFEFLPRYFEGWYAFGGNFAWMGLHLWYLEMLFLFSLITLPLFRALLAARDGRATQWLGFLHKPGAIFLLFIPIGLVEWWVSGQTETIGRRDFGGWSLLTYLVIFILGYVISLDSRFKATTERHAWAAVGLGLVTMATALALFVAGGRPDQGPLFGLMRGLNTWAWLVAFMGLAARYLNFSNPTLEYANQAVLPFYILHQTVIVVIGFFLASAPLGVPLKYAVLALVSLAIILGLYEGLVRRVGLLRYLFGMKYGRTEKAARPVVPQPLTPSAG